jgi:hypothetical protein
MLNLNDEAIEILLAYLAEYTPVPPERAELVSYLEQRNEEKQLRDGLARMILSGEEFVGALFAYAHTQFVRPEVSYSEDSAHHIENFKSAYFSN